MSIRGRLFHLALRHRHLFRGRLKPLVVDEGTSIEWLRRNTDETAERLAKRIRGITYEQAGYDKVYSEWVAPENAPRDKVVLYFHGGGFIMGNAKSHRNLVSNFVKRLGIKALVFDYRLAPEYKAPAPVFDAVDVYRWLLDQGYDPRDIAFAGDSSGGGILLATLVKCKDDGLPQPAACAAFSPCTDMTLSGESHRTREKADPCTPKGANRTYTGHYVGNGDPMHPYTSPLFADMAGLPPIIIQVGDDETLRDDSVRFAEKARQAGVEVRLGVWKGMFHCFPLMAPMFPEATLAMDEVCGFLRERLNPPV